MLSSLFSKNKNNEKSLKLKFDKQDNTWVVLKGHSIMFMGQEDQCRTYMSQFA